MTPPYLVIDCETIPCQDIPAECLPQFDEASVKLGNLKDSFKVREKIEEARADFEAGLDKKMSTDPDLCQICCAVTYNPVTKLMSVFLAKDIQEEFVLLSGVWALIRAEIQDGVKLVTFNGNSFDLPVLQRRAMIQDVSVAPGLYTSLTDRYSKSHIDLMQALAFRSPFSGKVEAKSLDHYLKRFCLGGKQDGMDGSMVCQAFKEGRFDEIVQYCKQDVLMTSLLFERIAPWLLLPKVEA